MTTIHCAYCSACIAGGWEVTFKGKPYHTACYDKLRKPSAKELAWRESDEERTVKAKVVGLGVIKPISHREILTMLAATSTDEEVLGMIGRPRVLPDGTVWTPTLDLKPEEIKVFNSIAENPSDGYPPNRRAIMEKVDRDREANAIIEAASCRHETTHWIAWKAALDTTARMQYHPVPSVDPEPLRKPITGHQNKATGGIVELNPGFEYAAGGNFVTEIFTGPYKGDFPPLPTETKAMQRTNQEVSNLFAHHPPKDQKTVDKHADLRNKFAALAVELNETLTDGRLKSLALTNLEQTAMWAQKSVALDGTGA